MADASLSDLSWIGGDEVADAVMPEGLVVLRLGTIRNAYLPLHSGLTVLFGANGAGKTSLLRGLRASLSGLIGPLGSGGFSRHPEAPHLGGVAVHALAEDVGVLVRQDVSTLIDAGEATLAERLRWLLEVEMMGLVNACEGVLGLHQGRPLVEEPLTEGLIAEVSASSLVLLRPKGWTEPLWDVCAGLWQSDDTPILNEVVRLVQALEDSRGSDLGPGEGPDAVVNGIGLLGEYFPRLMVLGGEGTPDDRWNHLPLVLFPLDLVTVAPRLPNLLVEQDQDLDLLTARRIHRELLSGARSGTAPLAVTDGRPSEGLRRIALDWQDRANHTYRSLLLDAPALTLNVGSVDSWIAGPAVSWSATSVPGDGHGHVSLARLSHAEQRWASFSVHLCGSLPKETQAPRVLLIDEPEAALHRSAEAWMANGLAALASEPNTIVVAATHAPALLDHPDAHPYAVNRHSKPAVKALQAMDIDALSDLGLRPSDLLARTQAILLVEGAHDEIVLKALMGEELNRLRAWVIPIRGGTRFKSTLDSQVLFRFTEAIAIAAVDNVLADRITEAWIEAQATYRHGDASSVEATERRLSGRLPDKIDEYRFLREWMMAALKSGRHDRLCPSGLSEPDIVVYLPTSALHPSMPPWPEIKQEMLSSTGGLTNIKKWTEKRYGVQYGLDDIERAAAAMDDIPDDIVQLINLIERETSRVRGRA